MTRWTTAEMQAALTGYFRMLEEELHNRPYVKALFIQALQDSTLTVRSRMAINSQFQRISRVLRDHEFAWIPGYKPHGEIADLKLRRAIIGKATQMSIPRIAKSAYTQWRVEPVAAMPVGYQKPLRVESTHSAYSRCPSVASWVMNASAGKCECCRDIPFLDKSSRPFLEVHHVIPLADGGPDTPQNAVALCPNCHRRLHHGADADTLREQLYDRIKRLAA